MTNLSLIDKKMLHVKKLLDDIKFSYEKNIITEKEYINFHSELLNNYITNKAINIFNEPL